MAEFQCPLLGVKQTLSGAVYPSCGKLCFSVGDRGDQSAAAVVVFVKPRRR